MLRQAWGAKAELAAARRRIVELSACRAQAQRQMTADQDRIAELRAELARERADRERLEAELSAVQAMTVAQDFDQARLSIALAKAESVLERQTAAPPVLPPPAVTVPQSDKPSACKVILDGGDPATSPPAELAHSAAVVKDATKPSMAAQKTPGNAAASHQKPSKAPPQTAAGSAERDAASSILRSQTWWGKLRKWLIDTDGRYILD